MRMALPRGVACRHPGSKSPIGDAHAHPPSDLTDRLMFDVLMFDVLMSSDLPQRVVDQIGDSLCHCQVAAEVSRWPASSEGQ